MSFSATSRSSIDRKDSPLTERFWVFAYGSLMWHWTWPSVERRRAYLYGYHRAMCLSSVVYRGNPENPGVGLGLMTGGECVGLAFRVRGDDRQAVSDEMDERELVTGVYRRVEMPVRLDGPDGEEISAIGYVVRENHPQFLLGIGLEEVAHRIAFARGTVGTCLDYVINTPESMADLGISDFEIERQCDAARLQATAGALAFSTQTPWDCNSREDVSHALSPDPLLAPDRLGTIQLRM